MRAAWKRSAALGMSILMAVTAAGCGKSGSETAQTQAAQTQTQAQAASQAAGGGNSENAKAPEAAANTAEVQYPAPPTEPVTIQFWHGNSGVVEETTLAQVEEFNKTNEYGITVEATYAGKYPELLSKASTAVASGDAPHVIMMSSTGIPVMTETGVLADMSGYIARDGIDLDNYIPTMMNFCYYGDQIVTLPYQRSVPVLYYNKTMFDDMGLHEPTSFEDLIEISKTIYEKSGGKAAGAGFLIDMFFYQEALVRSLGSDGIIAKDGSGPACLADGTLERVLKDWREGIEAGYFAHLEVTNTSSVMKEELYNGELGAMLSTSGNLGNFKSQFEELDYELGVCAMPVYGGMGGNIGGGNLGIVGATHSENEIAAAWEFVKFLQRDDATATFAVNTGYLPITYSCTETDVLKEQWSADPDYRIAFDVLGDCSESSWCQYQNEFESYMKEAASYVVQDFSWTPEEAVKYLEEQASTVFQ